MKEEQVYHVDKNDKVIGKVSRSEMRRKTLMHRSTGIITFNSKGKILIHKRTDTKDTFPGYYDIMNGGVVSYGESYYKSAIREIKEEIGVKNPKLKFLFKLEYNNKDAKVFLKIYIQVYDGKLKFQKEEVQFGKFVTIDELKKLIKKEKFCPDGLAVLKKYLEEYHGK